MRNITGSKTVKSLMLASMLALSMTGAYASEDLAPVPKAAEDNPKGTLDNLAGQDIPGSDPVQQYPSGGSAYTLTKVQEGGVKPTGDNIVTKFTYNAETQTMTPVYYRLDLKQTTFGAGNNTIGYNWINDNGQLKLEQVSNSTSGYDITLRYDNINSSLEVAKDEDYSSQEIIGVFANSSEENCSIRNDGTIGNITADFINNSTSSHTSNYTNGGVINNLGTIHDINGTFLGNSAINSYADGGAIYNYGSINDINANFVGNYIKSTYTYAYGGSIYNLGTINNITGLFLNNYINATNQFSYAFGGGIYSRKKINNINSDFIGNKISSGLYGYGGAIANGGAVNQISGEFINNYVNSKLAKGGAIANKASISDIDSNFIGNTVSNQTKVSDTPDEFVSVSGGDMNSSFPMPSTSTTDSPAIEGGGIFNSYTIGSISGDFIGNSVESFSKNVASRGGAISNTGVIGKYNSENVIIYPIGYKVINGTTGETINAYLKFSDEELKQLVQELDSTGAKLDKDASIQSFVCSDEEWDLLKESLEAEISAGSLTYVSPFDDIDEKYYAQIISGGITNASFIGNSAKSLSVAAGGAIYTNRQLKLEANKGYTSIISGNYVEDKNGKRQEAIYVDNAATLTFTANDKGNFIIDDKINGSDGYSVNFEGDETGAVYLNNKIESVDYSIGKIGIPNVSLSNITLNLGRENVLDNTNITLNSGTINMLNNQVGVSSLNKLTVNGDTNFVADVDLANERMDRFEAKSYGEHKGNLNVVGMNMLSDAPENRDVTDIYFAQIGLKDNVVNGVSETPTSHQTTAYTPIYKYHVMYDNRDDGGHFMFTKGNNNFTPTPDGNGGIGGGGITTTPTGNPSDAFNPSVLASPVAAQAGAYAAQTATFNYAFQHADSFMPLPSAERFAIRHSNQYAINETPSFNTRFNDFHDKAIWVRPYTTFENIPLKNGPKVDTITYGTLVGGDSVMKELRNGWGTVFTGYIGYNGSSQSYSGVDTYQNGGLIGATQTFYKGNFFTAITASAGASAGESHNMYGNENFSTLMAGVASKSGYNLEFKDGRFIIQPTLMLSYSFINTFDYRNSAGVKINSDPMHAIQINPNIRFIANMKNGWQPYASVGMVWNILDGTKVMANDVRLPEMSIKPYVEYGLGVQKRWKDKYTGYVQAMIRNGGRNGIALTGGFRCALGKEGKPIEKVTNPQNKTAQVTQSTSGKKIIKQLTQAQRTALGAKPQNTTRTTNVGILKQL